jgi:predicted DNA-binding WGR domain protein
VQRAKMMQAGQHCQPVLPADGGERVHHDAGIVRVEAGDRHRAYEITVGLDLLGIWVAEMTYGRIGAVGRTKMRSFTRIEDAAAAVNASLRRRATLPGHVGVAYLLRRVEFEPAWPKVDLLERLISFTNTDTGNVPDFP